MPIFARLELQVWDGFHSADMRACDGIHNYVNPGPPAPSVAGTPDVILETGRNFVLESELLISLIRLSIKIRYFG